MSVSVEDIIYNTKEIMDNIPNYVVYYALKEHGMNWVKETTVEVMKACLALRIMGFTITVEMLKELCGDKSSIYSILHRLGDYSVLTLIRDGKRKLRFIINPNFVEMLKLPEYMIERLP